MDVTVECGMDGERFDHLTRLLGTRGSRRGIAGGLLVAFLTGLRATAEESGGTAIADASGGNGNVGRRRTVVAVRTPTPTPTPDPDPTPVPCQPGTPAELCQGRCNRDVGDGCGGRVRCECAAGTVCGPGDLCCPEARLCLESDVCCPEGMVCAPNAGVCCAPERVCTVGGVDDSCCPDGFDCIGGVCQ